MAKKTDFYKEEKNLRRFFGDKFDEQKIIDMCQVEQGMCILLSHIASPTKYIYDCKTEKMDKLANKCKRKKEGQDE